MARAETLTDIVALESQIATRQAELESLLAQQATLADQVAMATVTTTLTADAAPGSQPAGFWGGLRAGADALVSFGAGVLTALGWALPFLLLAGLLALPTGWLWRRRARRSPEGTSPDPATERHGADQSEEVAAER